MADLQSFLNSYYRIGFLSKKTVEKNFIVYARRALVIFMLTMEGYRLCIGHPMFFYHHRDDFSEQTELLGHVAGQILTISNILTILLHNDELLELVGIMRTIHGFKCPINEQAAKIVETTEKICYFLKKTLPNFGFPILLLLASLAGIEAYIKKDFLDRSKIWIPIDFLSINGTYEFLIMISAIGFFQIITLMITSYLLMLSMLVLTISQLKLLNIKMRNLRSDAEATALQIIGSCVVDVELTAEEVEIPQITALQTVPKPKTSNPGPTPAVCDRSSGVRHETVKSADDKIKMNTVEAAKSEVVTKFLSAKKNSRHEIAIDPNDMDDATGKKQEKIILDKEIDVVMNALLTESITHHCEILKFINKFESFWNNVLSVHLSICLFQSVLLLVSWMQKTDGSSSSTIYIFMVSLNFYSLLALISFLSEKITEEAGLLNDAVFACDWTGATQSFKKSMLILISAANKPQVILAAGFVPISLSTFRSVMNSAYSYLTVLREFK